MASLRWLGHRPEAPLLNPCMGNDFTPFRMVDSASLTGWGRDRKKKWVRLWVLEEQLLIDGIIGEVTGPQICESLQGLAVLATLPRTSGPSNVLPLGASCCIPAMLGRTLIPTYNFIP